MSDKEPPMTNLTFRNRRGELIDIEAVPATRFKTEFGAILEEVVLRYTLISEGYSVKERHAVMAKLPVLDVPMMVSYVLFAYSRFCKVSLLFWSIKTQSMPAMHEHAVIFQLTRSSCSQAKNVGDTVLSVRVIVPRLLL